MTPEQEDKIKKIYELVVRGTKGEQAAAKAALDRFMKKYSLSESDIERIHIKQYVFSYSTMLDLYLLNQLIEYFCRGKNYQGYKRTLGAKQIVLRLEYLDYVTLDCAYHYFRQHMKKEYNRICLPEIKKCRTPKTKNAKRAKLQEAFFSQYVIASNIFHTDQISEINLNEQSKEDRNRRQLMADVEGGKYHEQVSNTKYLD